MSDVTQDSPAATGSAPGPAADQPIERLRRGGTEFVLLGTAHVSRTSAEAVRSMLEDEHFDAVAVELCESRYRSIRDPEAFRDLDLYRVIREGKAGLVAANLALSAFQKRLAEQFGIEPGAEMKAAIHGAEERGLPLWLVDREVGVTLKRAYRSVGFFSRLGIIGGLAASLLSHEEVSEAEVEKLKQGDLLGSMFSEFARESPPLYEALIGERDRYMAARLRSETANLPASRILVVIGAGHLAGVARELDSQTGIPNPICERLSEVPAPPRWPKWLAAGVLAAIAAAIAFAFSRGTHLGAEALRDWIVFTGAFAALGALAGGGHPLSILAAFVAAPLKPFRPGIPAGAVSAGAELWLHRPRVGDFDTLRDDVVRWRGWWKNRVSRILLVFLLTNLGTIVGEYVAGFHIFRSLM